MNKNILFGVVCVSLVLLVASASLVSAGGIGDFFGNLFSGKVTGQEIAPLLNEPLYSLATSTGTGIVVFDGTSKVVTKEGIAPRRGVSVAGQFYTEAFRTGDNEITGSWVSKRNAFILDPETDGSVKFYVFVGGFWQAVSSPANAVKLKTWEHWAGTYDGSELKLYKDGELVASRALSGDLGTSGMLCVGQDCGIPNRFFEGKATNVRVYEGALSAVDVKKLSLLFTPKIKEGEGNVACTDSDVTKEYPDGKNYFVKGTVSKDGVGTDYCSVSDEGQVVFEYFCETGGVGIEKYSCKNGCKEGACVASTGNPFTGGANVTDVSSGGGSGGSVPAGGLYLTSDWQQYASSVGSNYDYSKGVVKDTKGNRYNISMVTTSSSISATIQVNSIIKDVTEGNSYDFEGICVNIKDIVHPAFAGDIREVIYWIKEGNCGGSGGGGGSGSNATTGTVSSCSAVGCSQDGKCLPFGMRLEISGAFGRQTPVYCALNTSLVLQRNTDLTCQNSYECGSNVCASGKCVDAGLFQKIIDFFKRLFG